MCSLHLAAFSWEIHPWSCVSPHGVACIITTHGIACIAPLHLSHLNLILCRQAILRHSLQFASPRAPGRWQPPILPEEPDR